MPSWLSRVSTRRFILFSSGLILLLILSVSCYRLYVLSQFDQAVTAEIALHDRSITLQTLRYHSAQIQQFLTNASLTADSSAITEANEHSQAIPPPARRTQ